MSDKALLAVDHLTTVFDTAGGPVPAVNDVSFEIRAGETLGLVGESGSGKSVTALSIMGLVQPPGRIAAGRIVYKGRDLLALTEREAVGRFAGLPGMRRFDGGDKYTEARPLADLAIDVYKAAVAFDDPERGR